MRQRFATEPVRLRVDLPEKLLQKGLVGTVLSTWFSPNVAYEVEFDAPGQEFPSRVLLRPEQLETAIEDGAAGEDEGADDCDVAECVGWG